ncbi:DUF262 domain-containing protein [Streptomyces sp. GMY01]|uniref:DUF262 domain-containing protein n=1 Tax=Streptomyces sp. GMY02 TaxID=1333528 RepID=UPI00146E8143|nr:DUF262 domain-containing protein [Streptomyces sp. GMY02]NMO37307.1 DUF262 domain-containing protein [Streptomyces sp. GMY02]
MAEPLNNLPEPPEPSYFAGEQLTFTDAELDLTEAGSDEDLNRRYASGEVRIVTEQARYPLNTIAGMVNSDDYELNPEFQRRHRWDAEKQSRLIESFIMNVPVPPIFLYEDQFSHYEVMDGLQRLTAIATFYSGGLTLTGLTEWPELNGRTYATLPEQIRRGVDRRYLSSIILLRETAKTPLEAERLKQLVFERINSGGVALKEQETRNAIYNGRLNKLCIKLSRNPHLCSMWGIPGPGQEEASGGASKELESNAYYRTMFDVELVLRFFAHRQRRRLGTGALRTYLDAYLKKGNLFHEKTLEDLELLFNSTVELVHTVLGERAFWLWRYRHNKWGWLERPTTTAYDAFMFVFSQNLHRADALRAASDRFREAIPAFYEEYGEFFDARMTNMRNLRERDALVSLLVDRVLDADEA